MEKINMMHLMFIISGTTIVSMKTNITILLSLGGRDTWIAIGIASIIALFFLLFVTKTMVKRNTYDIKKIYNRAFGTVLGNVLLSFALINLIFTLIEGASVEASAMHTNLFIETPSWYFALFFVIPAIYTIKKGLSPLVIVSIIGVSCAIFAGINLVLLTAPYKDYRYLLPIMADNITVKFILAIVQSLGFYGSLFLVFPFYKYVEDKHKLTRFSIIGFLFVIQMHIVSSIGTIAAFGPSRASNLIYPKLIQTQEISLFGFLESGELFVLFQIIGGWFVKYVICFFVVRELLRSFKLDGNFLIYSISAVVLISTYLLTKNLKTLDIALHIHGYLSVVNFIIIPFVAHFIFRVRTVCKED